MTGRSSLPSAESALDPELLALPAPPRARRRLSVALLLSAALGAASLLFHVREDLIYSLSPGRAVDIGDAGRADLAELSVNRYVRVHGTLALARGVRYERPFFGHSHALFPLAGQRQIFVQVELSALQDPARVARGEFTGRLCTFGQLGSRLRPVRMFLSKAAQMPVSAESFVVLADEPPSAYRFALLLSAGCIAIMTLCLALLWRWFRPL